MSNASAAATVFTIRMARRLLMAVFALAATGCATLPPECDFGPLLSHDTTLNGTDRIRALGPIYERSEAPDGRKLTAVRPFFSRFTDPSHDKVITEVLWPVAVRKTMGPELFWRVLLAYKSDFDVADPEGRFRFVVFPFLFCGRDKMGERYFGIFPLGGTVNEYIGQDRIRFFLFPLYLHSEVSDVKTDSFLWPFVSRATSPDGWRFRVLPFYGRAVRDGAWDKKFIMWPFWTSVRYDYPKASGGGYILFPFYGHIKTTDQEIRFFLPPLFSIGKGQQGRERKVTAPYPLVQYRRGGVNMSYLWPFWGTKWTSNMRNTFVLWPMIQWRHTNRREYQVRRLNVVPILYTESRHEVCTGDRVVKAPYMRYVKIWPFFSYRRERDATEIRALELWPYRNTTSVARNLQPLWTLYSRDTLEDQTEDEFLWGIYRHRRNHRTGSRRLSLFPLWSFVRNPEDDEVVWNFLGGLVGSRRRGLRREVRLLYWLNIGRSKVDRPAAVRADPAQLPKENLE